MVSKGYKSELMLIIYDTILRNLTQKLTIQCLTEKCN